MANPSRRRPEQKPGKVHLARQRRIARNGTTAYDAVHSGRQITQEIAMFAHARLLVAITLGMGAMAAGASASAAGAVARRTFVNWPAYLHGKAHSSDNGAATAITPAKVAGLTRAWTWKPAGPTMPGQPSGLLASPTVVNGRIYIGANTGVFYALDEATGHVIWHRFLGFVPTLTCGKLGIVATATVAKDPVTSVLTVYVAGGDGYLYALNTATGKVAWRSVIAIPSATVSDYYDWSSPTIAGKRIYVGVSSNCDSPLVAGGLKEYNQATGSQVAFYQTYPGHSVAPSIWSSAAVSTASRAVFVTTGNGPGGDAESVVRLKAAGLARTSAWQVPAGQRGSDSDFGGSPTLFSAVLGGVSTPMVGACNKNGTYYAWRQGNLHAGPVWQRTLGAPYTSGPQCDAAAVWNGKHLFVAANHTTINGKAFAGSIRMVNPATGAYLWQRGISGPPIGTPTLDGAGVLAVTEYVKSGQLVIINAATGSVLRTIATGPDFGQPVFADNMMLVPTQNNGLWAYKS
jgi:outer membrane protein assembly factor BamB